MTAFDAALSDSAVSKSDSSATAADGLWPDDPAPPARGHRAESYRQLWQPPGRRPAHRQALGQPYVWAGSGQPAGSERAAWPDPGERPEAAGWPGPSGAMLPAPVGSSPALPVVADEREGRPWPDTVTSAAHRASIRPAGPVRRGRSRPAGTGALAVQSDQWADRGYQQPRRHESLPYPAAPTERAVIGNLLRVPTTWCQSGTCISWHSDPAALGELDIRARAVASGWCVDAIGRMICPACQQRYHVWSARPLVPWTGRPALPAPGDPRPPGPAGHSGMAARHRWRY